MIFIFYFLLYFIKTNSDELESDYLSRSETECNTDSSFNDEVSNTHLAQKMWMRLQNEIGVP